jgi:hypothetical protein
MSVGKKIKIKNKVLGKQSNPKRTDVFKKKKRKGKKKPNEEQMVIFM